jgi:hypothetical protein
MDHVVYVDAKSKEMDLLLSGQKTMVIRGAAGRKLPYGRVNPGDVLYFINNNGEGLIKACAHVVDVFNSEKLTKEGSVNMVRAHREKLQLTQAQIKRWAGKRYLVLIDVNDVEHVEPFRIDKSGFSNMDDWLLVGDIQDIKL